LVLDHAPPHDVIGLERSGVGGSLKEGDGKRLPCDRVPRKGHEEDLGEELVVKRLLAEFVVLHDNEVEVGMNVLAIRILLLEHADFRIEGSKSGVDVCMLGF